MYRLIVVLSCLLAASCVQEQQKPVTVQNAWIREAPPNAFSMAGYLTFHNNTSQDCTLTCAKSKHFKNIEFHRTIIQDGVAKMRHHDTLTIPPSSSLVFQPGDFHLMLMRPQSGFRAGDELMITLCVVHDNRQEEFDIIMPVKKPRPN